MSSTTFPKTQHQVQQQLKHDTICALHKLMVEKRGTEYKVDEQIKRQIDEINRTWMAMKFPEYFSDSP
jgi:hypothetical protein